MTRTDPFAPANDTAAAEGLVALVTIEDDVLYRVVDKRRVTPVIVELLLRPVDRPLRHRAGDYVLLSDEGYRRVPRSYSLANAPDPDGRVSLLVTRVPGGEISGWVHDDLASGDTVLLSGPYGSFHLDKVSTDPLLLLAGGSGMAPVRALAEEALALCPARPVTLVFSARTLDDVIDEERFHRCESTHPNFRYVRTLTRADGPAPVGRIPAILADHVGLLDRSLVYVAGGSGFVAACADAARALGAQPGAVVTEEFFTDPHPWVAA